ncbi:hypothetical protein CRE_11330 [Caenorhabditis remanei]|nr:hypothetical protein CRE_11328 [Caenorhabditis remanei]EFP13389.1 hypothetical protein CRE_11327 [Caenorhabditis remanei]EFP13395.1 hypothetical protein CRE_11329 [Caenorhabditis remanei]EFP13410.1 hypothetical protein CRE_11326 [Caenorhabditis remanei]EFP13432.1 hypothetical protein CRE_11330 [Caenorhabditis remanei]
MKIHIFSIISE